MKYMVCYVMHCSHEVESDSPEHAIDVALDQPYCEMAEQVDDVYATVVYDEDGLEYCY